MANDSLYVIGSTAVFDPEFLKYQQGEGHYYNVKFKNLGGIRRSNDGTKVLLEEQESKYLPEHLDICEFKGTDAEAREYTRARPDEWRNESDEGTQD